MNEKNRIFDDLGKLINDAAGIADGMRREIETAIKAQMTSLINDMNLVKREDYDALRELVQVQSEELARIEKEVEKLRDGKQ